MRLCIPIAEDKGLDSVVYGHFGSAPCFIVVDTETNTLALIDKHDQEHSRSGCNPVAKLDGHQIDALLVSGIGAGAIDKLNAAGVRVHLANGGSVADIVARHKEGLLPELALTDGCQHHGGCDDQ